MSTKSESTGPSEPKTANTRIIAKNAVWSAVEVGFGLVANFFTSVAIARVLGKDAIAQARLGSYQYIVWLTTITLSMGTFGLPSTTRRYMAEYLNNGQPEVARGTYLSTLKIQSYISVAVAAIGFLAIMWLGDPGYFAASVLLVLAIVPRLIAMIPSQANNAAEAVRRNARPAVAGVAVTATITLISLVVHWDYVGLSAAVLAGALLECSLKLRAVESWMGGIARGKVAADLRSRMLAFSGKSLALLVLNLVVWDRSDIMILKALNPDTKQIVYFSTPFSLAERILLVPTLFAGALGFTMMAQYGRGQSRLKEMTADGGRYALLMAAPLLVGMACISRPLVMFVYGKSYAAMIPTVTIIALLAIPKGLVTAPTFYLQTTERQGFLIVWGIVCGAVDIGLDFLLCGSYGAKGAAIANGSAQTLAAIGTWIYLWRADKFDLKLPDCGRIVLSAVAMALGVLGITNFVHGLPGLLLGVSGGAVIWFVAIRLTRALKEQDVGRFLSLTGQLPSPARPLWKSLIAWLAPAVPVA